MFIVREEFRNTGRGAASASPAQIKPAVELTSPLKLAANPSAPRARNMKRSMSMSLFYDGENDDEANSQAFDDAFANVDSLHATAQGGELDADLRAALLGSIDELSDELYVCVCVHVHVHVRVSVWRVISVCVQAVHKNISDQALEHIHADEVILTYGKSKTVQNQFGFSFSLCSM